MILTTLHVIDKREETSEKIKNEKLEETIEKITENCFDNDDIDIKIYNDDDNNIRVQFYKDYNTEFYIQNLIIKKKYEKTVIDIFKSKNLSFEKC